MSTATVTPAFGDFDEWEREFRPVPPAEFRVPAPRYNPNDMPELSSPACGHRPARGAKKRAAIDASWREFR